MALITLMERLRFFLFFFSSFLLRFTQEPVDKLCFCRSTAAGPRGSSFKSFNSQPQSAEMIYFLVFLAGNSRAPSSRSSPPSPTSPHPTPPTPTCSLLAFLVHRLELKAKIQLTETKKRLMRSSLSCVSRHPGRIRTRRTSSGSTGGTSSSVVDSRGRSRAKVVSQSQRT